MVPAPTALARARACFFAASFLLPGLVVSAAPAPARALPEGKTVLKAMERANDYFVAKWPVAGCLDCLPGKRPSNIWTRAVYFEGAMALHRINRDPAILRYALDWADFHRWAFRKADRPQNADDLCAGQIYLELHQLDPSQPAHLAPIRASLDRWARSGRSDYYTWIDALQMSMPALARLGVTDGNPVYHEKMFSFYDHARTRLGLYNAEDRLWWRDTHFKPPFKTPAGRQCYWSRGNGWVAAALVRVLDVLPRNDPHRAEYETLFRDMCAALLRRQREDGFWNVNLDDPNDFGGPETTGTALFVYSYAWGVRKGLLPAETYTPALVKGWTAITESALHPDGFLGYVQGTGDEPSDSQPVTYESVPDFEDFGLGCFLLAGSEVHALGSSLHGKTTRTLSLKSRKTGIWRK